MRKQTFCICENKDADQLHDNREAYQRFYFHYIDSTIPLLFKIQDFKRLAIFYDCTAWFVSDLVKHQNVCFLMTRLMYIPGPALHLQTPKYSNTYSCRYCSKLFSHPRQSTRESILERDLTVVKYVGKLP